MLLKGKFKVTIMAAVARKTNFLPYAVFEFTNRQQFYFIVIRFFRIMSRGFVTARIIPAVSTLIIIRIASLYYV